MKYLKEFDNGELITLAEEAGDSGQYINVLRKSLMQMQQTGYGMLKLHSRKSEKSYSNTRLLLRVIKLFLNAPHLKIL